MGHPRRAAPDHSHSESLERSFGRYPGGWTKSTDSLPCSASAVLYSIS